MSNKMVLKAYDEPNMTMKAHQTPGMGIATDHIHKNKKVLDQITEDSWNNKIDNVEGEGLSEIKRIEVLRWMIATTSGTITTSPIEIPNEGPSIYARLQDGSLGSNIVSLYSEEQIRTMMGQANTAFRTKISYSSITDDALDGTLNAGWYRITSTDDVENYMNTWMLVTKITNNTSTSDNIIPIVRQTILGDETIKYRTYFGKVKVTNPNDIPFIPDFDWYSEDGGENNNVSTFAAPPTVTITVEYTDTYWSEWITMVNKSYVDEAIRTSILDSWEVPI